MAWFKKDNTDEEQTPRPRNEKAMMSIRVLAVGYLFYLVYQMIDSYIKDTADKPSLWLMIGGCTFLTAGAIFIAIITYKEWQAYKKKEAEEYLASLEAAEDQEPEEEPEEEEEAELDDDVPNAGEAPEETPEAEEDPAAEETE